MTSNPYNPPEATDAGPVSDFTCPYCNNEMEPGSLRPGLSINWHPEEIEKKRFVFSKAVSVSQTSLTKGAVIDGFRCVSCGAMIMKPLDKSGHIT